MAKRIIDTGKAARRIEATDRLARRIEPKAFAEAIGAKPCGEPHAKDLDPISLSELGNQLLTRLRSTGGRPALADATEFCRVPLTADDVKALEKITSQIEKRAGAKPSVGQLVSVIVHDYLTSSQQSGRAEPPKDKPADPITSWLPRLAEIARNADAVQKSAIAIESTVKAIKEQAERRAG